MAGLPLRRCVEHRRATMADVELEPSSNPLNQPQSHVREVERNVLLPVSSVKTGRSAPCTHDCAREHCVFDSDPACQ